MAADNNPFNVLEHDLVPEHHLLTEEEADAVMAEMNITRNQLPKIMRSDAAIVVLENILGQTIPDGSVIKVVRKSETAEEFVAYRIVKEN